MHQKIALSFQRHDLARIGISDTAEARDSSRIER